MKIAIVGASGKIGRKIMDEALTRGHQVTAIVRDVNKINIRNKNLEVVTGNVMDTNDLADKIRKHDVVISSYGPGKENPHQIVDAARSLINSVKKTGVNHLIVVGGAGSLEVEPGRELINTPEFPEESKPVGLAHREALKVMKEEKDIQWTYASPAARIEPGLRTGKFRVGADSLLKDKEGKSMISVEDFAMAVVNEAEKPRNIRKRFTVAY